MICFFANIFVTWSAFFYTICYFNMLQIGAFLFLRPYRMPWKLKQTVLFPVLIIKLLMVKFF